MQLGARNVFLAVWSIFSRLQYVVCGASMIFWRSLLMRDSGRDSMQLQAQNVALAVDDAYQVRCVVFKVFNENMAFLTNRYTRGR